jgi:hypothetical protein
MDGVDLMELAASVSPAGDFVNIAAIEMMKTCVMCPNT